MLYQSNAAVILFFFYYEKDREGYILFLDGIKINNTNKTSDSIFKSRSKPQVSDQFVLIVLIGTFPYDEPRLINVISINL